VLLRICFHVLLLPALLVLLLAGVILGRLELGSLAGTIDNHVHVLRLRTLRIVKLDGKQSSHSVISFRFR